MRTTDLLLSVLGVAAAIVLVVVLIWVLLLGWPLLVAIGIVIMFALVIGGILLGLLVFLSAIPCYFVKRREPEWGDYRLEDVRDPNDRERR